MQRTQYYGLQGGMDLITPAIETKPGRVIAGLNHEPHPRGYQRIDGFERFDGHPKPSEATYYVLDFDAGTGSISEGQTVTGATSLATGVALIHGVLESGDYGTADAAGYLVLTAVAGTFDDNENLQVGGITKCVADGEATERGALSDENDATWFEDAIETARNAIDAVPGSGPVRGVWTFDGDSYAFRDNAGGTAGQMWKSTTTGWELQALGRRLAFTSGGTYEVVEGDILVGESSGAFTTVTRVVIHSGSFADGDAAGYFISASQTGTFQAETLQVGANPNVATIAADGVANTLPAGGHYDFENHNFFGASDLKRMYGCNGLGMGFEWDGTVFVPIRTGMVIDWPTRVTVHRNHLFFAFRGGSLQFSSPGDPHDWQVVVGAGEIGLGEDITDLLGHVSGSMTVLGLNKVAVLLGDDIDNFDLKTLADDAGGVAWTAQRVGSPIYLDSIGVRSLDTTERFGDFSIGTLSQDVEPLFRAKRKINVTAVGSIRVRSKSQYRLFWSDGTGLTIYFGRDPVEIMPFDLNLDITCTSSGDDDPGSDVLLVGTSDGYVFQLDSGTSLDGEEVPAFLRLPFNHVGSPAHNKRWHKVTLEVDSGPQTTLGLIPEFGYADPDQPPGQELAFTVRGAGGFWDEMNWDDFYWSSPVEGQAEAPIDGLARNISVTIVSSETYEEPYVLHGLVLHYSPRGIAR